MITNLIGNAIKCIYDLIGNIGVTILIVSFIMGIISLLPKFLELRNSMIKAKYMNDVKNIEEDSTLSAQLKAQKITALYKKDKYIFGIPAILKVILLILNVFIFTVILDYTTYIVDYRTTGPQSFLFIKNVFSMEWNFILPIICGILPLIINNLFNLKYLISKEAIADYILAIVLIFSYAVYAKLFSFLYVIYIFGNIIFGIVPVLLFHKYKKSKGINISQYQEAETINEISQ